MKKFFLFLLGFIAFLVGLLYLTGNQYVLRGIQLVYLQGRTTANIYDAQDFENNIVEKDSVINWEKDSLYNQIPISETLKTELESYKTTSFLVLKDQKIFQEEYWEGDEKTASNSFSMAKTITTLMIQKAIEDGFIKSWEEPITNYLPEYKNDAFANECTLADLSKMTSGFDWQESYTLPLNPTAKAYYDNNMDDVMLNRKFIEKPNSSYKYLSGNTQLLGYILQRSLDGKTLSQYLSESFWKPLGMTQNALWTVDHKGGIEKTYCCIHSNARDFAKFGQLLLQKGKYNGKQLVDSTFTAKMVQPNNLSDGHYGYSVWTEVKYKTPFYFLRGHLGQYVICIPKYNIIIVRLGENRDNEPHSYSDQYHPRELYIFVDETLKALQLN